MKSIKKHLTALGLLLTLIGAGIAAKGVIITEHEAMRLVPGIPVGPTFEQALRNSPVFQSLVYQSHTAMWGLILVAVGTAVQLAAVYLKDDPDDGPTPTPRPEDSAPCPPAT
jgi:hypothetical protein